MLITKNYEVGHMRLILYLGERAHSSQWDISSRCLNFIVKELSDLSFNLECMIAEIVNLLSSHEKVLL